MPNPKINGNQFWLARSRHGRNPLFSNASDFKDACIEYFEWCEENPLYEEKVGFNNGLPVHAKIAKMRVMTLRGLCLFLDISPISLLGWRKTRLDLAPVIEWAEMVIYTQKFTGAAAGLLNTNLIIRDLGLIDKQSVEMTTPSMTINPPQGECPPEPPIFGE